MHNIEDRITDRVSDIIFSIGIPLRAGIIVQKLPKNYGPIPLTVLEKPAHYVLIQQPWIWANVTYIVSGEVCMCREMRDIRKALNSASAAHSQAALQALKFTFTKDRKTNSSS